MDATPSSYDDRWMTDLMSRMRVRDAVASLEREFDAVCPIVTRRDVERHIGRSLSGEEWTALSTHLREEGSRRLLETAPEALARPL